MQKPAGVNSVDGSGQTLRLSKGERRIFRRSVVTSPAGAPARRRTMARLLAIIALALSLSFDPAAAAESKPGDLKLRVGLGSTPAPALPNSVLWLAKDQGFYKREGLEVELIEFNGSPIAIAAMIAGEIDVGNIGTSDVIRLVATKRQPLRAIHSPDARLYFLIAARDEIASVSGLESKQFGVARIGSVDHSMSTIALKALGANPAKISMIAIGSPSTRAQALVAGRVDATTLSIGSWVTIRKQPGIKVLVDQDVYFNTAAVVQKVNAATTKIIQEKPEHLRRFTSAILKASRHFAENQEAWVEAIVKRRPDVDRTDAASLWAGFKTAWAINGLLNFNVYKKSTDFFYQSGNLDKVPKIDVGEWTESRFVDDVLKEIGVYGKFDPPGRAIK
jgi:NitT/TauT family transport system substrate-binding protein